MSSKSRKIQTKDSAEGWWIYEELEYWVSKRQKTLTSNSKCKVWANIRIVKAKNIDAAYKKALKLGQFARPIKAIDGEWRFAGIMWLLPIQERLEDGAELVWTDRKMMQLERIDKLVKTKLQLCGQRRVSDL